MSRNRCVNISICDMEERFLTTTNSNQGNIEEGCRRVRRGQKLPVLESQVFE